MKCHDEIVDYKATFDADGKLDSETLDYLDCQADISFLPWPVTMSRPLSLPRLRKIKTLQAVYRKVEMESGSW